MNPRFLLAAICLTSALAWSASVLAQQPVDPDFTYEFVYTGNGIISLRFDAQGRLYANEKQGRLLRFSPDGDGGFDAPVVVLDISAMVNTGAERGLLGLELDPDFLTNRFFYLLYTTDSDQRVVRYRINSSFDGIDSGTETLLLTGLPNAATNHKAGDLHFSPADPNHLYVALGDDAKPALAADLDSYEGKLLRIDKATGLGVSSNPFFNSDTSSVRSRVWARGFRNPFRFTFHPGMPVADVLYVSENGNSTDRISWVQRGSDGNWNTSGDGFQGCVSGCFLDPLDSNHRVMLRPDPSQIGIAIIDSGPFAVAGEPTLYAGNWFPGEFSVRRWTLSGPSQDVATPVAADMGVPFINSVVAIDLQPGPNDCLYSSQTGGGNSNGSIFRICYLPIFKDGFESP